jgi:hypothetical protein
MRSGEPQRRKAEPSESEKCLGLGEAKMKKQSSIPDLVAGDLDIVEVPATAGDCVVGRAETPAEVNHRLAIGDTRGDSVFYELPGIARNVGDARCPEVGPTCLFALGRFRISLDLELAESLQ